MSKSSSESDFEFVETPRAASQNFDKVEDCGVHTTTSPTIHNAPLPADGPGNESFSYLLCLSILIGAPTYISWNLGGGFKTTIFFALFTTIPLLAVYWMAISTLSPRANEKARFPGRPVEHYITFKSPADKAKYRGKTKIPMETFHEKYFDGDVEFNGDCLDIMEYRHDWATFTMTFNVLKYFLFKMVPEVIMHTQAQDEEQVRDHYDRGNDFYSWFLGPRMVYTSGVIGDPSREETLEQLQDNKMAIVCEKIGLQKGDTVLDLGCGWGTLARFASVNYGAKVTGVTLARNQTSWGNDALRRAGIPQEQSEILCQDYREILASGKKFKKITCLEMSEHVGVRHFSKFIEQIRELLDDDGVFFMQYAGLRKHWQFEDFIWGLFMNKYIFPGADASTPLGWTVDRLEGGGFEIKGIDTIGVHYSATLWRWYRNWQANHDKVIAKYGARWYRIWEFFLAYSVIASRQGTATCFQITMVKNINSTHRIEGVPTQFALFGALRAARVNFNAWAKNEAASFPTTSH